MTKHRRCCECCDMIAALRKAKRRHEKKRRGTPRRRPAKYFRDWRARRKATESPRKGSPKRATRRPRPPKGRPDGSGGAETP